MSMKEAGIREVRQNLSALIGEVRKGHEIVITDRGRAVARLLPPLPSSPKPFPGRTAFRRNIPKLKTALSEAVINERNERG
jgi:prevent-host-death family protein